MNTNNTCCGQSGRVAWCVARQLMTLVNTDNPSYSRFVTLMQQMRHLVQLDCRRVMSGSIVANGTRWSNGLRADLEDYMREVNDSVFLLVTDNRTYCLHNVNPNFYIVVSRETMVADGPMICTMDQLYDNLISWIRGERGEDVLSTLQYDLLVIRWEPGVSGQKTKNQARYR